MLAACTALMLLGGCSSGPYKVPTRYGDCRVSHGAGSPDGGVVAGLDWPPSKWTLGTPGQAYVCIGAYAGSTLILEQTGSQLTIQPSRFTVPLGGGVLPFSITATAKGKTTLWFRVVNAAGERQLYRDVAEVVADGKHWHFKRIS
jgi:hypothetical protein